MCVWSRGLGSSESTLHSKLLVIVLAHLFGGCALNERQDEERYTVHGVKPERAADVFRRNLSRGYTEGAENRRDTCPAAN